MNLLLFISLVWGQFNIKFVTVILFTLEALVLRILKNSFKLFRAFHIELEIKSVSIWGERKTGVPE